MSEKKTATPDLSVIRNKKGFIIDMDGVIYHTNVLLPGAKEFLQWLKQEHKQFLFLTNSSEKSPLELRHKLLRMGIDVEEGHFYTSALATAAFLSQQSPGCSAYAIGAPGLVNALHDAGITFNDINPDYVVVGETTAYNYEMIVKATQLINKRASSRPIPMSPAPAKSASSRPAVPWWRPSRWRRAWRRTTSANRIPS